MVELVVGPPAVTLEDGCGGVQIGFAGDRPAV